MKFGWLASMAEAEAEAESENCLAPWKQHASIISMPRFNYSATLSLPHSSSSGFLITCAFDREKSATKEALGILKEYISMTVEERYHCKVDPLYSLTTAKEDAPELLYRRKRARQDNAYTSDEGFGKGQKPGDKPAKKESELGSTTISVDDADSVGHPNKQSIPSETQELKRTNSKDIGTDDLIEAVPSGFSLLKLSCKGIIFIILPDGSTLNTVDCVSKVLHDIQIGAVRLPQWCQRLFPVASTFLLTKDSLKLTTIKLVKQYLEGKAPSSECVLKYAVGFNRRGVDLDMKSKNVQNNTESSEIMGRIDCIQVVAVAVKEVFSHTVVDLSSPQMVVIVEVLPLAGVHNPPVCAMAVLPGDLVNTKPKLSVKPLILQSKRQKSMH